ncbi:MAG: calcium-binding protein [Chromatiales bacterium]
MSAAGDINGDGVADLLIGAFADSPNGSYLSGASYVVFGKDTATAGNFPANIELSSLDGTTGFKLSGVTASDFSGRSVSAAGDINGDDVADLIIAAYTAGPNGTRSGASYVVFGQADTALLCDGKVPTIIGTSDNDQITGTEGPDVIHGLGGRDFILGGKGNDVICGGLGKDILVGQLGDDRLFGQQGNDFLIGNNGADVLEGGEGRDRLFGNSGTDSCDGGPGLADTGVNCEATTNIP